jgi:S-DNA-T family DNA segregation ATPase FtsK/SpoIIIE
VLNTRQRRELLGVGFFALSVFLLLSLIPPALFGAAGLRAFPEGNIMGVLGRVLAERGFALLGAGFPMLAVLTTIAGCAAFAWLSAERAVRWAALATGLVALLPAGAALVAHGTGLSGPELLPASAAGWLGSTLALPLAALLGWFGAWLALVVLLIALCIATVGWNPAAAVVRGARGVGSLGTRSGLQESEDLPETVQTDDNDLDADAEQVAAHVEEPPISRLLPRLVRKSRRVPDPMNLTEVGDPTSTDTPPVPLLSPPMPRDSSVSEKELDRLGEVLIATLRTFKVEGEIVGRTTGPVVTQFEVVPAPGVKVNRIAALDADLALALKAPSVRIVAPIPGKGAVGVEVPNPKPEIVALREILESPAFQKSKGLLPLALGKDLMGRPYVADLAKMPHLLIAGATGSGKSVCINTLITSLIYRYPPQMLRLLLIDPKMVELSMYGDLPHLRHPVVTDPQDAAIVLKWAVLEMERRYALLSENGARSLAEFNQRVLDGQALRRTEPQGEETDPDRWLYTDGPLPFVVVVLDELADLMMAVQAEIERPLAQLAQKARAIGIHLVVATQRPSVNVITGLIKANFPCRIAFRVSSKVDSRTIIDQNGADALLGNGDLLFLPPGSSDPIRVQGAYLSTEETERLMRWYQDRGKERARLEENILEVVRAREAAEGSSDSDDAMFEERDALFRQAAEICIQFQQGSTSLLQRRLRVGYGRAARIIDQLHHAGVLGPPDGSRPREVLIGMESLEHVCQDN